MKKRVTALLLAVSMLLTLTACGGEGERETQSPAAPPGGAPVSVSDPELQRAYDYGFVPDEWTQAWDRQIKSGEFLDGLSAVAALCGAGSLPDWEAALQNADTGVKMRVAEGRLAVYMAACAMGMGQTTNGNWSFPVEHTISIDWDSFACDELFSNQHDPSPFYDVAGIRRCPGWDYETAGTFWCLGQFSPVSGKNIFDWPEGGTVTGDAPLTRELAARALARLYESTFEPTAPGESGPDAQSILSRADARREAILTSETNIARSDVFVQGQTYTGTAYYVSNRGRDSAGGTSPEQAWATLEKVNSARLRPGDAVFFHRGDTWYGQLWGKEGVTYSAYGEGDKPLFSGSSPAFSDPASWTLYSGRDGKMIWQYKDELGDVSGIFFNSGAQWAEKFMPCWDGERYTDIDGIPVGPEDMENLMFFSAINLSGMGPDAQVEDSGRVGPLYLRCDSGNPAEVFADVQAAAEFCGFSPWDSDSQCTVDNLRFYDYGLAVSFGGYQSTRDTLIQNCEIGWSGGFVKRYENAGGLGIGRPSTSGGAMQISGAQNTARNNYIHDCDSKVFVLANHFQEGMDPLFHDVLMEGNLLERCAAALHAVDYSEEESGGAVVGRFRDVTFRDNLVLDTGYGWYARKAESIDTWLEHYTECALGFGGSAFQNPGNQGILIENNVFYRAKYALVHCYMPDAVFPAFQNNTYAQAENGWLADVRGYLLSIAENAEEHGRSWLHDRSGTYICLK